ncbi:MAG: accessory factor UbiK family protein [Gammaproteobacteria bacterium]
MFDPKLIDELTRKIADTLPQGVTQLQSDMAKNMRAVMAATLERMDLVTRQEFDVQVGVLTRTREKLAVLEAKVAKLEQEIASSHSKSRGKAAPKGET